MKNISQNMPNGETIKTINRITKTFRSAKRGNRARMLKTLAGEIKRTENTAVRNWLVRFNSILKTMEVSK